MLVVGLDLEDDAWHATTFTKNRQRLLDGKIAAMFLAAVVNTAESKRLLSKKHFSVDGTLLDAWASHKSVRRIADDDQGPVDPDNTGGTLAASEGATRRIAPSRIPMRGWRGSRTAPYRAGAQSRADLRVRFLPYGDLAQHRETMARFGTGRSPSSHRTYAVVTWQHRLSVRSPLTPHLP